MQKKVVLCCSYPKSGRSWLRFILAHYINNLYQLEMDINFNSLFQICPNNGPDPQRGLPAYRFEQQNQIPLFLFDHGQFHPSYQQAPIIFIIRGLLDTLVSKYFQDTQRIQCFRGTMSDYLCSPHGLARLISYLNNWSQNLQNTHHIVISYELMHQNIHQLIYSVLDEMLPEKPNETLLNQAIENSTFSKMKNIEMKSGFPNQQINIDKNNPNALRARKGKVNGYHEHLSQSDIDYVNDYSEKHLNISAKKLLKDYCEIDS